MSELSINTTQNVKINFTVATVGERFGAYFIDLAIKVSYIIVVFYIILNLMNVNKLLFKLDRWEQTAVQMTLMLPYVFYTLVSETFLDGQTIGKRTLKIKVVKIDGYQAAFGDYLIRWILRLVEVISVFGVVGFISIVVTEKVQRLGDMASGTAVITLKNNITINHTIIEDIGDQYKPIYPLVIKLSDNDIRIIKETFNSAVTKYDTEIINKLATKIETVTGTKNQSGNNKDFIRTVLKDYNYYTQSM